MGLVKSRGENVLKHFSTNVEKAYEEGVYSDTLQNRKLGRVGKKYSSSAELFQHMLSGKTVDQEGKEKKAKEDSLWKKFVGEFHEAYDKREGKLSVEEWDKLTEGMSKLPIRLVKQGLNTKGLIVVSDKILRKRATEAGKFAATNNAARVAIKDPIMQEILEDSDGFKSTPYMTSWYDAFDHERLKDGAAAVKKHNNKKMDKKVKYLDTPRYPKISEKGYEKDFKTFYTFALKDMIKDLAKKMVELTK